MLAKIEETLEGSTEAAVLDKPLSGQEDATLDESQINLQHFLEMSYVRPPNVGSLREWGQELLVSGKRRTLTFEAAFGKDMPYAVYMARKITLTSVWARSFQNFAIAKFKALAKQKLQKDMEDKSRSRKPDSITKDPETTKPVPEDDEWKLCPAQEPTSSATGSSSEAMVSHRSKRASAGTTSGPMKEDMTAEQRLDLLTKQALLRRELTQSEQTLGEGKECGRS